LLQESLIWAKIRTECFLIGPNKPLTINHLVQAKEIMVRFISENLVLLMKGNNSMELQQKHHIYIAFKETLALDAKLLAEAYAEVGQPDAIKLKREHRGVDEFQVVYFKMESDFQQALARFKVKHGRDPRIDYSRSTGYWDQEEKG